jgi:hypothetical protein
MMDGLNFMPWRQQRQQRRRRRFFLMLLTTCLCCMAVFFSQGIVLEKRTLSSHQHGLWLQQVMSAVSGEMFTLAQGLEKRHALRVRRAEISAQHVATVFLARVMACLSECPVSGVDLLRITYNDQGLLLEGRVDTGEALEGLANRIALAIDAAEVTVFSMQWRQREGRYQFTVGIRAKSDGRVSAMNSSMNSRSSGLLQ